MVTTIPRKRNCDWSRGNAGCFMNLEPYAMTGGMSEILSQTSLAQDAACCFVYVTTGDSQA